ncbi:MAG: phosphoribosylformylglycinamidine cyclo-ligase [Clostridiales bacterium]|nr:phosphoribosylformylglycinamidine cyclo-ligase [Clostridiales bacterium]
MKKNIKYDVNIDLANETKKAMAKALETKDSRVLNRIGAFSSLYDVKFPEYKDPVLVLKTEEPGSKQLIAAQYDKLENVSYDMINHLINDCIVMGAKPLTVQDAIICGKMDKTAINKIVKSVADACKKQDCVLTGGETSEQPGVLKAGTYILTSSIVGIVDKDKIIDGSKISVGDVVISLESSGIHTNGYTLVRKIMKKYPQILDETVDGKSFIDAILEPHRCYYKALRDLFETGWITGLAHITGGGICENLNRILPENVNASIDAGKYKIPEIFKLLKKTANIDDKEMLRTFNLGVGLTVVAKKEAAKDIIKHMRSKKIKAYEIGEIVKGNKQVVVSGEFKW